MFKQIGPTELIICGAVPCLIIVVVALVITGTLAGRRASKKSCPFCAESIKVDATVCRFCGRDLPTTPEEPEAPE